MVLNIGFNSCLYEVIKEISITFVIPFKCDISFLGTLSSEEIDRLKQSVNLALNRDGIGVDYYPIPKGLNNKLRKFIHDNPLRPGHASLGSEDSFLII